METKNKSALLRILIIGILLSPHFLLGGEIKLCLTMIVKNEEKIIERCLDSVKEIVDCISICDTGSTDNTVKVIEQYLRDKKIPGKIYKHEWKNFGHNRTLSVQAAQKTLEEFDFSLSDTYLLLIDADMMLEKDSSFNKNSLQDDYYLIVQKNHFQSHYNNRLIRASLPWESLGVTHEYWSCKKPSKGGRLQTLRIDDKDDGGCKADKFERDVRLLTQGLKDEPDNVRYMFYLAQSYKCLKNYEEAVKWYKMRIEKGGWVEEVWFSKLMIGQCYEVRGQWDQALLAYLDAYQFNPERAEPLQQISTHYRIEGQNNLAYSFAKQGSTIPYPSNQILFITDSVYDFLFDQDISISAYYTPFKEEGYAATNRLILKKSVPSNIKEQAYRNMLFYVETLKNIKYQPIEISLPHIREGFTGRYNPMNPSIKKTEAGYDVICRTVNYMQIGAKHFRSLDLLDESNRVKTRNFFVKYDRDFNLLSQQEIIENLPRERKCTYNVEGLEDCRIFGFNDSTWFTCTTLDTNPTGKPQISLCELSDKSSDSVIQVKKLIPLVPPNLNRCEKNWMPFVKDNELHVIYSYDPLIIYKPKILPGNGTWIGIVNDQQMTLYDVPKHDFSRFSGSAAPIEFDNGYLSLVHETVYNEQRNYMHRFIFFDKNFKVQKVSKPFIFFHKGIEYCCGMAIDHSETKLIMTVGVEDREAYLGIVDLDTVRSLLETLP